MDLVTRVLERLRSSAAATTVAFVLGVSALVWLLNAAWTTDSNQALTDTFAFGSWVGLCALTAGVWVVVFIAGCHEASTLLPNDSRERRRRLGRGTGSIVALASGATIVMLTVGAEIGFEPDVPYWMAWQACLLIAGATSIGPWVLVTWWTHDALSDIKATLAPLVASSQRSRFEAHSRLETFTALRETWPRVERCTAAMAVVVTSGVLSVGALRVALLQEGAEAGEVPGAQQVLLYGLFFAVFVAVVVIPLVLAYRRRAAEYLEAAYPAKDPPGDASDESRVSDLLYLARGPLRDPWAVLGVLAPVVTGALAAYLPGLGG